MFGPIRTDYKIQTNEPVGEMDNNVIILPLAILASATVLVILAVIIMGVKLHKQKDRINRGRVTKLDEILV